VRDLPDRERHVITSHYLQQRAFAEVAEELGVTRGRVSQLHRDGIERLRRAMKRRTGIDLSY
jgi:RNA polymerase sigma factor for flagellar operon FliA